jgi:hypothetical protein
MRADYIGKFFKEQICAVLQHGDLRSSATLPAHSAEKIINFCADFQIIKKSAQIF